MSGENNVKSAYDGNASEAPVSRGWSQQPRLAPNAPDQEPQWSSDASGLTGQDHVQGQDDHGKGTSAPQSEVAPQLSQQAALHFAQYPAEQFVSEFAFNPCVQRQETQPPLPLPSQLLGNQPIGLAQNPDNPIPYDPQAAQWSVQELNPFVRQFQDPELDRESSGVSVFEPNSVLGESGRFYHGYKEGSYLLPNDPAEQDRLDFQHGMMTLLWDGRLVLSPLPRAPKLVLDVATGTGIWALECARANPTSFVIGTDLSKIQPDPDVPNCLFEQDDCEEDWHWTHKFDYIHIRMVVTAIRNPQRLIKQAYKFLNPGGWIEMQDASMELLGDDGDERVQTSLLNKWFELSAKGAAMNGFDLHKARHYKDWLTDAGFSVVQEEKFKVPCGPWPEDEKARQVGKWMQANYLLGLRGVSYNLLRSAGMPPDEIEGFIAATKEEVKHGNIRGYTPWYAVYGRKPFDGEAKTDEA